MIITYLKEENVKGLKVIEIEPGPEGVVLVGKNGAGKSSTLDGIIYALNGGSIPVDVIRETQRKAEIKIHLGGDPDGMELKITKTFTRGNTKGKLTIEGYDGDLTPQKLLDTIVGSISFNPTRFMDADTKKQRDMLLDGLGLTDKLNELTAQEKKVYGNRTEVGRERDSAKARLDAVPKLTVPAKVDIEAKQQELDQKKKAFNDWADRNENLKSLEDKLGDVIHQREQLEIRETELRKQIDELKPQVGEKPEFVTTEMEQEIREAYATNQQHDSAKQQNQRHSEAAKAYAEKQAEYDTLSREIEKIRQGKTDLLANIEWPVEGLGFDDDGLLLNDRKFEVASLAERIRAACLIGMAMNPKLRVMIIDGNAFDDDNLAQIKSIAQEKNYQLWIEMVRGDGKPCIEIEDGMIKESDSDGEED